MKTYRFITLSLAIFFPLVAFPGTVKFQFKGLDDYTDFSVSGLSKEKTLPIFEAELQDLVEGWGKKYLEDNQTLVITFTDVDMAGDIQPWRNIYNADIRYLEDVYPPRLKFTYVVQDADDVVIDEGEASLSDISYQDNVAAIVRNRYEHFFYETELLDSWLRKTFSKKVKS